MQAAILLLLAQTPGGPGEQNWQPKIIPTCSPASEDGAEIVVCGRRDAPEPYRLPPVFRDPRFNPDGPVDSVSRERNRLLDEGGSGVASCTNVGPGAMYGCAFRDFKRDLEQKGK